MIVLDEHLHRAELIQEVKRWYHGSVKSILSLRPGTIIKDDNISTLLRQEKEPTFVTINEKDFWQVIQPDTHFCIVCLSLTTPRISILSQTLRDTMIHPLFGTKAKRMGKIIRVVQGQISFYSVDSRTIQTTARIIRELGEMYEVSNVGEAI